MAIYGKTWLHYNYDDQYLELSKDGDQDTTIRIPIKVVVENAEINGRQEPLNLEDVEKHLEYITDDSGLYPWS